MRRSSFKDEIFSDAIIFCFKLINTLNDTSETADILKQWHVPGASGQSADNVKAMWHDEFMRFFVAFNKTAKSHGLWSAAGYLHFLASNNSEEVGFHATRGVISHVSVCQYRRAIRLMEYGDHLAKKAAIIDRGVMLDIHQLLYTSLRYMIGRDTIENGTRSERLNDNIAFVLENFSAEEVKDKRVLNVFVSDRIKIEGDPFAVTLGSDAFVK